MDFDIDRAVSFDTEFHMTQPGLAAPPLVCGAVGTLLEQRFLSKEQCRTTIRELLQDSTKTIVGAFIVTDFAVCAVDAQRNGLPDLVDLIFKAFRENRVYDVLLAESLLDLQDGCQYFDTVSDREFYRYSLAMVTKRYTGHEMEKGENTWRKRYAQLDGMPIETWPPEAISYPKDDVKYPLIVMQGQLERVAKLRGKNKQDICNIDNMPAQLRAQWTYHLSSIWGMNTDPETVAQFEKECTEGYRTFIDKYAALNIFRWDEAKKKHTKNDAVLRTMVEAAYREAGLEPARNKKTKRDPAGSVKADRDALADCGSPLLAEYAEQSKILKEQSTFLDLLKQGLKAPINPEIDILKATGRVSYSKPNLQQIPNKPIIRKAFVPPKDFVYCSVDYSAIEMCTLAQVCLYWIGRSKLAEAINNDMDVHCMLGARFLNVSYEEFWQKYKEEEDEYYEGIRSLSKVGNFGFPGGMGAFKLVKSARARGVRFCLVARVATRCGETREYNKDRTESVCAACLKIAKKIQNGFMTTWSEMDEYFMRIKRATRGEMGGSVITPVSLRIRGECGFNDGANNPFQSLAADGAKRALELISAECYTDRRSILWGSRVVLGVHDQIILSMPEERAPWAGDRQAHLMRKGMVDFVPNVKIKAEPALMRFWSKKAKTVRDDHGLLKVWEPK